MSLEAAHAAARAKADTSLDPADHRYANALAAALAARKWLHDRHRDPVAPTDDIAPWSQVSGAD
ncbi:MAG TPA: hypothetical protein VMS84_17575 [Mycobacterium sp.]|nr:hypothetical protein [Mycobacterium sp.]